MRETDRLIASSRGSVIEAKDWLDRAYPAGAYDDAYIAAEEYIEEMYRLAPLVGMDPAIVIAQSAHETANWTSPRWMTNRNPAGLGIARDDDPDPATFTGIEAARVHLWALLWACEVRFPVPIAMQPIPHSAEAFMDRWMRKYGDPNCPTVVTIDDLNTRYTARNGTPQATWAWDDKYTEKLIATGNRMFPGIPDQGQEQPRMGLNMTKGLISLPHEISDIIDVGKRIQSRECRGYDWLGLRPDPPEFLVLHRPQSPANASISNYFHQRCCPALTDLECSSITGQFRRFVERGDAPSGWANGVVSNPYGDALKYLDHYGWDLNRVNRCGESVEVSGWFAQPGTNVTQEDPISEACWQSLARWIASRAHDYGIPWDQFPIILAENNRSYITWHQEWTIGTGKICPGRVLMDGTARLIELARSIMRAAQTATAAPAPEIPQYAPLNVPDFLTPRWINGGEDARFDNGVKVFSCRRRWQARAETTRLQHAGEGAPEVGPVLPAGRSTIGVGVYHSHGRWIILTEWGERLEMDRMTDFLLPGYPTEEAA